MGGSRDTSAISDDDASVRSRFNNLRRALAKTTPGQGNGTGAYRRTLLTGVHHDAIFWGSMPRPPERTEQHGT